MPAVRKQIDTPDPRWLERLGGITAETLVVAGGPGSHAPQDGLAEPARRIPGGRAVTIPAGHLIHSSAPEAFTEALSTFRPSTEGFRPARRP
ncbi:alpha/beta fold hydrolase [Streptomyces sp. NPDC101151]|uniref:alpha/beta fold hydrolase n=1 Tax=Streptomyces sp. NPDC101151 TaxID=3366115 RepID=UPI003807AFDD